ncbi:MAG: hypothetical protein KGZ25_04165 [Planctomycetes bacterium]|nr:hypothetical protein [Planctomycetota bacterium]
MDKISNRILLLVALVLALCGLRIRWYLDQKFETLVPEAGDAEVGILDSFFLETGNELREKEEK